MNIRTEEASRRHNHVYQKTKRTNKDKKIYWLMCTIFKEHWTRVNDDSNTSLLSKINIVFKREVSQTDAITARKCV